MLGVGLALTGVRGVGPGSPANRMLAREAQGLALSFVDDFFLSTTSHYGSARVKDTSTPANNYNSHPFGLLTYSSPSVKLCRGPNGLLRYGAHNLCAPSEDFTAWNKSNANVTADQAIAPNGTMTADLVEFTGNVGSFAQINRFVSVAAGYSVNYSIYIMAADEDNIGKTVTIDGNAFSGGSQSITLTGSWQKVNKVLVSQGGSTQVRVISYPAQTATRFYVWGAHVRCLPSDPTYLKTTDSAVYELPYEWDENGDLLGIVKPEPQRTNLITNSRSVVSSLPGTTVSTDNTAPDGDSDAYGFTEDETDAERRTGFTSLNFSQNQTLSFFVRRVSGSTTRYVAILASNVESGGAFFDLSAGTAVTNSPSAFTASIENFGNGFWRCSITRVNATNQDMQLFITDVNAPYSGSKAYTGDGESKFVFWGWQREDGTSATSPIVTAGSTVTRAADVIGPALDKFPWNEGNGVLTVNDEEVEPSDDGTILTLDAPSGDTHIQTVKWVPSP